MHPRGDPAEQHVGADTGFEAVEHRSQRQGGLEVPEAAFGLARLVATHARDDEEEVLLLRVLGLPDVGAEGAA